MTNFSFIKRTRDNLGTENRCHAKEFLGKKINAVLFLKFREIFCLFVCFESHRLIKLPNLFSQGIHEIIGHRYGSNQSQKSR